MEIAYILDVPQHESPVAEINEKIRHSPAILEIKPNVELKPHSSESIYQPHKFNPSFEINHGTPQSHKPYFSSESHGPSIPSSAHYKPGTQVSIKHTPRPLKTVKLVSTPGLKHYATYPKLKISRNDYQNFLRNRNQNVESNERESGSFEDSYEDSRESFRPIRRPTLYRRVPKSIYQYAPSVQTYAF